MGYNSTLCITQRLECSTYTREGSGEAGGPAGQTDGGGQEDQSHRGAAQGETEESSARYLRLDNKFYFSDQERTFMNDKVG